MVKRARGRLEKELGKDVVSAQPRPDPRWAREHELGRSACLPDPAIVMTTVAVRAEAGGG